MPSLVINRGIENVVLLSLLHRSISEVKGAAFSLVAESKQATFIQKICGWWHCIGKGN